MKWVRAASCFAQAASCEMDSRCAQTASSLATISAPLEHAGIPVRSSSAAVPLAMFTSICCCDLPSRRPRCMVFSVRLMVFAVASWRGKATERLTPGDIHSNEVCNWQLAICWPSQCTSHAQSLFGVGADLHLCISNHLCNRQGVAAR